LGSSRAQARPRARLYGVASPGDKDPPETATATTPGLFMPADPQPGDQWKPEDLFPVVDETVTLTKSGVEVDLAVGDSHPSGSGTRPAPASSRSRAPANPSRWSTRFGSRSERPPT